jgi:hypothetical protein
MIITMKTRISSGVIAAALTVGLLFAPAIRAAIVQFPAPDGVPHNDDFTVTVRAPGVGWQELFEYSVRVDQRDELDTIVKLELDRPASAIDLVGASNTLLDARRTLIR